MSFLNSLTIGRYIPDHSPVHRLDPRTKIIAVLVISLSIFLLKNLWSYFLLANFLLAVIIIAHLSIKFVLRGLLPLLWIIVFTFFLHLLFTPGTLIASFGPLKITEQGLSLGTFIALRLIFLILIASLLTLTTSPQKLTKGLEFLLSPLKIVRISSHKIAMMMTLSLRFVPLLFQEMDKLIKAQKSRGSDFSHKNPIKRIRAIIPILLPLLVSLFRRADEFAQAMESRAYDPDNPRGDVEAIKFRTSDLLAILIIVAFAVAIIIL
ncbi:MAG: energy-coupling factor transporter transmembrane protein EcfT [Elusimicrobiota bacterium]|nr:energy-coupling factor transporter transmembrane protein EcfT [Elusimicrobiota bacterium]MDH5661553.1 energy-coupling factor transporter transmembrane protein EcfT [Elusimicrobiota bacterium]